MSPRENPWRLTGASLHVALFVAAAFGAGGVIAAAVDLYSDSGWDSPVLQAWTLVPQVLASGGLLFLGRNARSKSFAILGALVALIVVEEAFHVLNPVAARLAEVARWARQWSDIRLGVLNGALVYGFIAAVGLGMLAVSHWHGSVGERRVVRNLAVLLLMAGIFGGPISILSGMGNYRLWLFIEELGEATVFALIAGYVAGLVALFRAQSTIDSGVGAGDRFRLGARP